jgi:hypothetical protein
VAVVRTPDSDRYPIRKDGVDHGLDDPGETLGPRGAPIAWPASRTRLDVVSLPRAR